MKAIWNGTTIAQFDATIVVVAGKHYFPAESLHRQYFIDSDHQTVCPWKGTVSYYTVAVDGQRATDAAWTYPSGQSASNRVERRFSPH